MMTMSSTILKLPPILTGTRAFLLGKHGSTAWWSSRSGPCIPPIRTQWDLKQYLFIWDFMENVFKRHLNIWEAHSSFTFHPLRPHLEWAAVGLALEEVQSEWCCTGLSDWKDSCWHCAALMLAPRLHQGFTSTGLGMGNPEATQPLPHTWDNEGSQISKQDADQEPEAPQSKPDNPALKAICQTTALLPLAQWWFVTNICSSDNPKRQE